MKKDRELYIDLMRTIAIFFVVLIHSTCGYLVNCYPSKDFNILLIISALTSSAVPLFYMISGIFLLKTEKDILKKTLKKTLKIFLQLIIWSSIYLLIFKYIMKQEVFFFSSLVKSIFTSQVSHLWFMYPLIGLYILGPLISKIYFNSNEKEKKYMLLVLFFIPTIISTIMIKYNNILSMPLFAIGFPELGIFVLGKYLYDKRNKFENKKSMILSTIGIIVGIITIILLAEYYINLYGISHSKPYFDYNKIPNVILIVSIFTFFTSINKYLKKLPRFLKKIINFIGKNTGGIYFCHMIYIYVFPSIKLFNLYFTSNIGNLNNMILGSIIYFILSVITVFIIKKIPLLNKIV